MHVPRHSKDDPLKIFRKGGICTNSLGGDMHSHARLLVFRLVLWYTKWAVWQLLTEHNILILRIPVI